MVTLLDEFERIISNMERSAKEVNLDSMVDVYEKYVTNADTDYNLHTELVLLTIANLLRDQRPTVQHTKEMLERLFAFVSDADEVRRLEELEVRYYNATGKAEMVLNKLEEWGY